MHRLYANIPFYIRTLSILEFCTHRREGWGDSCNQFPMDTEGWLYLLNGIKWRNDILALTLNSNLLSECLSYWANLLLNIILPHFPLVKGTSRDSLTFNHHLAYSALTGFCLWQEAEPMYRALTMNTNDPHPGSVANSRKEWCEELKMVFNLLTLILEICSGVFIHAPWIWACSVTVLANRIHWEWCYTNM